jgi:heavy metal translocating P-type ATPase
VTLTANPGTTAAWPSVEDRAGLLPPPPPRRTGVGRLWAVREVRWATAATLLFALGGVAQVAGTPRAVWWVLYLACYPAGGWEPAAAGLRALRRRVLDVDLLMIVAAVAAAGTGQVLDGALLIVIFATSGALEAVATARTADSVRALLDLAPEQASRIRPDGTEETVDTARLQVDDVIRVRPGERIGADAVVLDGRTDVDQSTITGEPLPVLRTTGDEVFAGTLNGTGVLTARVHRPVEESVLARIVALVDEASATKARAQLFIEKAEQRYSLGVVAGTCTLFGLPLVFGAALEPTLLRAMTFMIVASPCAVVLATMPPLLSAIAQAGRNGVLVKSAVVLEQLATIDQVVFDKTGTLTEGTPHLVGIHLPDAADGDDRPRTADRLLQLAAAAEHLSEHPLATAVLAAAHDRGLTIPAARDFTSAPGRGVAATIEGHRVHVGRPALLDEPGATAAGPRLADEIRATARFWQAQGHTAVVVIVDDQAAGVLTLTDRIRPRAADTIAALGRLTARTPVLLTGDNPTAARLLADQLGIREAHGDLLPADKVRHVRGLRDEQRHVLLVGDGVNDAPALAAADLGAAMGGHGSDLALRTADIVLVHDDLATLPALVTLARRARRVVRANLLIAAVFISVLVAWDLLGDLPLPLGVAGHEGSTVLVGLNGLRLLRAHAWHGQAEGG